MKYIKSIVLFVVCLGVSFGFVHTCADKVAPSTKIIQYKQVVDSTKIIELENEVKANSWDLQTFIKAKKNGFADSYLAKCYKSTPLKVYNFRKENNIYPVYKFIDTCAGEFDSYVPYFYSTYEHQNESIRTDKKKIVVLGSGPIRIGQGVEFDYTTVHAIWGIIEKGYEAIIINNNPETVSTDYTISDKLYFEPLTFEDVMNVIDFEKPEGVVVALGGQTAINLASRLDKAGIKIFGSSSKSIDLAEDRDLFEKAMEEIDIPMPKGYGVFTLDDAIKAADEITFICYHYNAYYLYNNPHSYHIYLPSCI